jgi:UDP-sulfoquinovose synthase
MENHNAECTCWNCPAIDLTGKVDFRSCGQSREVFSQGSVDGSEAHIIAECKRRPKLGLYDPMSVSFEECPEWKATPYGYLLKDMRVIILGIDGYLGWTLALWLGSLGVKVAGVDNFSRRDWVKERGARTIIPISRMTERLHAAKEILGINIDFRKIDILNERNLLREFIEEIKPEAIIHYGECPSAPYSMINVDHATFVQRNNVLGTLGLLFTMRDLVPETSLIKLGTMGEYGTPLTGRPLFEGVFPADAVLNWEGKEWSLGGELTPRDPGSMQGVIYGVHTPQVVTDPRLRTRLDIDEWFGTVVNRFVAQAVIGFPLTIYGAGEQIRGFIGLEDAMQCMTRLIAHPPEPGQYDVVNQMSGFYSVRHLAETVAKVASQEFNLPVTIQRVENPRVESDIHPFEPIYNKLPDRFGFKPEVTLEDEIYRVLELLTKPHVKERIEEKKHLILPKTWWSGIKKPVETLEIIEEIKYEPSVKAHRP